MNAVNLAIVMGMILIFCSCVKDEAYQGGAPLPPQEIILDSTSLSGNPLLVGEKWTLYRYRIGNYGEITSVSDSLSFESNGVMQYNGIVGSYNIYMSASVYVLTMYSTPWGNLTGALNTHNIESGEVIGLPFSVITPGAISERIYLWMVRN